MPLDLFAITFLLLAASLAWLLRLRAGPSTTSSDEEAARAWQTRMDPVMMNLPLSGIDASGHIPSQDAYLPAELTMLLEAKAKNEGIAREAVNLDLALAPAPKVQTDRAFLRLQKTLIALTILLGLTLLLFWLISIF